VSPGTGLTAVQCVGSGEAPPAGKAHHGKAETEDRKRAGFGDFRQRVKRENDTCVAAADTLERSVIVTPAGVQVSTAGMPAHPAGIVIPVGIQPDIAGIQPDNIAEIGEAPRPAGAEIPFRAVCRVGRIDVGRVAALDAGVEQQSAWAAPARIA